MAKRRGKRRSRRTKTIPLGATVGGALGVYNVYKNTTAASGLDDKLNIVGESLFGINMLGGGTVTDGSKAHAKSFWIPMGVGVVASALLPKVPIVRTIPKKIPIVGKMLRW